ncbi:MAG: transposase [Alphaproteobacteria bacterium]|nr:transposase [Alphaproteobacteria bacterium]
MGCNIVFYIKCRYRILYNNIVKDRAKTMRAICSANHSDIINENVNPDHMSSITATN